LCQSTTEAANHLLDLHELLFIISVSLGNEKLKISGHQSVILESTRKAESGTHTARKLPIGGLPRSFGNITRDIYANLPHHIAKAKQLITGKIVRDTISLESELMCLLPDEKITKVLHIFEEADS